MRRSKSVRTRRRRAGSRSASRSSSSVARNAATRSGGQVADEAHRVGDDHLALAREAQPARRGIERREHLVRRRAPAVRVSAREQRALAGVRVADDRERSARRAARAARGGPRAGAASARARARGARCGRARGGGPSRASSRRARARRCRRPSRESEVSRCASRGSRYWSCASSTWSLPSRRRGALREDVEDQLRAVDDAQVEPLGEVPRLARREVAVEDHEVDVLLEAADREILELAGADQRARVDAAGGAA